MEAINNQTEISPLLTHVVFSHGKESGPRVRKILTLMGAADECGLDVSSVDYRSCANASERVNLLRETLRQMDVPSNQVVLVGSSMGGYVSMVIASEQPVAGLFLMAPALWLPTEEYPIQSFSPKTRNIDITHGFHDDIVPFENSVRFAMENKSTVLHLVPDDHRLSTSHDFLVYQFKRHIERIRRNHY